MNKKIFDAINTAPTLIKFTTINPDFSNIEEVYQNNLLLWFINNGDSVETKDGKGIEIHNNTVLNPENIVVLKTKRGFKITENDFIKSDLETLDNLNVNLLTFTEKKQFEFYKNYLKKKNTEPQQQKNNEPDEVKKELHNNIFIGNAIYLFEKYFENKLMTCQSRTDFRFLFEQMKKDNLIYNTVTLGQYIKFIGNYGYDETELKSIEMDAVKNIQRTKDYNEYKDNLKKTLK